MKEKVDPARPRSFPAPSMLPVHKQYTIEATPIPPKRKGVWGTTGVTIYDNREILEAEAAGVDTSDLKPREVFRYERNYHMGRTFFPFRQLQDDGWHDYALISSEYVRFEVVDLEKGEIAAVQPYPTITQEYLDGLRDKDRETWAKDYKVGDEKPAWGFCPTEFKVFNWAERYTADAVSKSYKRPDGTEEYIYSMDALYAYTGQWALYVGCVWGDDSSYKLRYIDLSRIKEGVVTSDERFGYFPAASLSDIRFYHDENGGTLSAALEVETSLKSGKSIPMGANWMTDEEADEYFS